MQLDVQDVGLVEFPDDATDQEIQDTLNELFPSTPKAPITEPPSTLRAPQAITAPKSFMSGSVIGDPQYEMFARTQTEPHTFEELQQGLPSKVGVGPEIIPSGQKIAQSPAFQAARPFLGVAGMALPEPTATVASSAGKAALGIGDYLSSSQGITELVLSMTPARLVVLGKWAKDMAQGAGQESGALSTLINKPDKTPEDWQAISDHTVNTLAMLFGAGGAAKGTFKPIRSLAEPKTMRAVRELSDMLESTEPAGRIQPRQPIRQLGIPQDQLTMEPFLQPGIQDLAGRALAEAQSPLEVPGRMPAIEQLRRELEPPSVMPAEPTRLAERIPGGGEAPYGKTSFMREAEAPTTERTQNAIQQETAPPVRDVRQPEVAPEGAGQVPPGEGSAKAAEARVASELLKREPGETTPTELMALSDAEARAFFEGNKARGNATQFDSVLAGQKLGPESVPELEAMRNAAQKKALEAIMAGDETGAFAGQGRVVWLNGAIEGALKRGPNYQAVQSRGGVSREKTKGQEEVLTQPEAVTEPPKSQADYTLYEKPDPFSPSGKRYIVAGPEEYGIKLSAKQSGWKKIKSGLTREEAYSLQASKNPPVPPVREMRPIEPGRGEEINAPSVEDVRAQRALEARQEKVSVSVGGKAVLGSKLSEAESLKLEKDLTDIALSKPWHVGYSIVMPEVEAQFYFPTKAAAKRFLRNVSDGEEIHTLGDLFEDVAKEHGKEWKFGQQGFRAYYKKPSEVESGAETALQLKNPKLVREPHGYSFDEADLMGIIRNSIKNGNDGVVLISDAALPKDVLAKADDIYNHPAYGHSEKLEIELENLYESNLKRLDWKDSQNTVITFDRTAEVEAGPKDIKSIETITPDQALDLYNAGKISKSRLSELMEGTISKLESLKFKEKGGLSGELYTLRPDIIQKVGKQLWNDTIDLAIASVRAGKAITTVIDEMVSNIKRKVSDINEAEIRTELKAILEREGTPRVPATEGESVQMRKSAERATTSEMVPEPVQEQIKTAPESFYKQQSMKRVEDAVGTMSEADLAAVPRDSNLYTAARLEQSRRLFERGENEAGYNVFVELEKEGTRLGQLINQFKLLKGTRPEDVVRVINSTLTKAKKDPLNKAQEKVALETARKSKDADRKLEESTDAWTKNPTPENAAKAEQALLDANKAGLELQRFLSKYQPRSTASIIKSVLQGNLLTPISEVANIVGNMSFLPFRAADRTVATALDVLYSYLKKTPREITVQPVRGTAEALKGLGRGSKQIPDIFLRGTGDVIKGETRAGLHPIKAWINQFAKNPEMPTTGGKLTLKDRLNLAIEGTFGVPAEAMLRGLGAGDVAFREAAKSRATATELELAGVPKGDWNFARKFPELFLDDAALQRIQSDTLQAVFQRPSKTLNLITGWLRGRGEWLDLLAATVAPYKMTPWNIVGEILSYNPLIALSRSINDARLGSSRSAKLNAGKYVVGTALTAAGWWLYKNGLMSPSLDQRDESQKSRILAGEVMPPNHINLSGLKRALSGGDPAFQKGDETVDVFRAGGLAGSMFYMTANIGRDFERMPEVPNSEVWLAILRQSTLEQARFGMNQSFLSGVEGLLSAVREGNTDNYIRQWGNTVASIPMPNTMTVMSRATREYKPDFREDTFRKQMENIVRNKLGVANMDDYLPLKRGLWGEPLRETPEGRNALLYHFFDVFKNKQVTSDPVPLELFRLWRKTTDSRVIPSLPEKTLTIGGNTYALNAAQQSRYAELVGQSRRRIVDAIVVNPEFHKVPDEAKIEILDRVYNAGLQQGKALFWNEVGGGLELKPARAGFESDKSQ